MAASRFLNDAVWRAQRLRSRAILAWWRARGATIGRDVRVLGRVHVDGPLSNLTLGDGSRLNHGVVLDLRSRLTLGRDVHVSAYAQLHTAYLDPDVVPRAHGAAPILVEDHTWIASNAVVGAGITLGRGCVVAAGAVVLNDVGSNTLAGGVPARTIRTLGDHEDREAAGNELVT